MNDVLLTDTQVSKETGISLSALRKARCATNRKNFRVPPHVRIGGRVHYRFVDVIPFLRPTHARLDSRGRLIPTDTSVLDVLRRCLPPADAATDQQVFEAVASAREEVMRRSMRETVTRNAPRGANWFGL